MSKYTISEVVKMIPVWHNIGMFKAMEDGDPKHNIDYQEKATKAITQIMLDALPAKQSVPVGNLTTTGAQVRHRALGYNKAISEMETAIKLTAEEQL